MIEALPTIALWIGYAVMSIAGAVAAGAAAAFVWWVSILILKEQFLSLRKVYRVEVLRYYFKRIEKYGWRDLRNSINTDRLKTEFSGPGPYTDPQDTMKVNHDRR